MSVKDYMVKKVITINKDLPLPSALDILFEHNISHLVLVDAYRRLVGIVSEKDILAKLATERTWNVDLGKLHISSFVKSEPLFIKEKESVRRAIEIFIDEKIGILPILDDNKAVRGVVTKQDFLPLLYDNNDSLENVLNRKPIVSFSSERFREIRLKIVANNISLLPVIDEISIKGVITDIRAMQALTSFYQVVSWRYRRERIRRLYVNDIMDRNFERVGTDMDIASLARLFYEKKLKGIIVVHDDAFIGLITKTDLLKTLV